MQSLNVHCLRISCKENNQNLTGAAICQFCFPLEVVLLSTYRVLCLYKTNHSILRKLTLQNLMIRFETNHNDKYIMHN